MLTFAVLTFAMFALVCPATRWAGSVFTKDTKGL
jgi:hypothetical protein